MQKLKQPELKSKRNSCIELLKVFGIFLIVISHVIQTLHTQNAYVAENDYIINISRSTTDIQQFMLALLRYSGTLGNTIFFVCSAWFLLDSEKASKKKILQLLVDVWVVSIIILIVVYIIRDGNISKNLMIKQIFPTTFNNNWYITCYLLFYPLHPFLNWIIKKMEQKTLLKATLVLFFLYGCANYILPGLFFASSLVLWITIYFTIAYMKYYLTDLSNNMKSNILMLVIGLVGNLGIVCLTNFLGLHFGMFSNKLIRWCLFCSPFLLLVAISMLNIARNMRFDNRFVNYISSLSLLIYIIHENMLLRTFYRPVLWIYVHNQFGYEYILVWLFVLVIIVFAFGLIASIIYKHTIQKAVTTVCSWLYPVLQKIYRKIEKKILKLH